MKKTNAVTRATQWHVVRDIQVNALARQLEGLSANGWDVHSIIGPLSGGFVIVARRQLVQDLKDGR